MNMIFDIQRGSYVDGPGVRTVVFFKGCNLDCEWCHNPESKSYGPQLMFYKSRCSGCGKCLCVCENGAVRQDFTIDPEKCVRCGQCADVCPADAKSLCGRPAMPDEIMAKIRKDYEFYESSGGGVTFSGGECMTQPELLYDLIKGCHAAKIATAVDTAGNVPFSYFERILPYTDLFLYDIKHMDEDAHRRGTGVSNKLILQNLEKLLRVCPEKMIIRIPLIPGFNDDDNSLRAIGRFLGTHPAPRMIEPLPYHKLGEHKSEALGKEAFTAEAPSPEKLAHMKKNIFDAMEEAK